MPLSLLFYVFLVRIQYGGLSGLSSENLKMIDPTKVTNFYQSDSELEEFLIFWVLVAGKRAIPTSIRLEKFLKHIYTITQKFTPFNALKEFSISDLSKMMKEFGFGCYNRRAESLNDIAHKNLNLKTCSLEELLECKGIGNKTARCFLIHSRKDVKYAGLDTHALRYLRDLGYNVPRTTPNTNKKYKEVEDIFLSLMEKSNMELATFDLMIWNKYSGN